MKTPLIKKPLHEQMLEDGVQTAPEPETAEQRTRRRRGGGAALGGLAAIGATLAKIGILGKIFLSIFAWHAFVGLISLGGWYVAAVVAAILAIALVYIVRMER